MQDHAVVALERRRAGAASRSRPGSVKSGRTLTGCQALTHVMPPASWGAGIGRMPAMLQAQPVDARERRDVERAAVGVAPRRGCAGPRAASAGRADRRTARRSRCRRGRRRRGCPRRSTLMPSSASSPGASVMSCSTSPGPPAVPSVGDVVAHHDLVVVVPVADVEVALVGRERQPVRAFELVRDERRSRRPDGPRTRR